MSVTPSTSASAMSETYAKDATPVASAAMATPETPDQSALECSPSDESNAPINHYAVTAQETAPKLDEMKHSPRGKTLRQSTRQQQQWKNAAESETEVRGTDSRSPRDTWSPGDTGAHIPHPHRMRQSQARSRSREQATSRCTPDAPPYTTTYSGDASAKVQRRPRRC